MTVYDVLLFPNKMLTTKTEVVTDFSGIDQLIKDMIETATANNLVGLAANQIGISKSVIVVGVQTPEQKENEFSFMSLINPSFKPVITKGKKWDYEGCGSMPGWKFLVERWNEISVKAHNSKGEESEMNATGFIARIIQHEVGHLQGNVLKYRERKKS